MVSIDTRQVVEPSFKNYPIQSKAIVCESQLLDEVARLYLAQQESFDYTPKAQLAKAVLNNLCANSKDSTLTAPQFKQYLDFFEAKFKVKVYSFAKDLLAKEKEQYVTEEGFVPQDYDDVLMKKKERVLENYINSLDRQIQKYKLASGEAAKTMPYSNSLVKEDHYQVLDYYLNLPNKDMEVYANSLWNVIHNLEVSSINIFANLMQNKKNPFKFDPALLQKHVKADGNASKYREVIDQAKQQSSSGYNIVEDFNRALVRF